MPPLDDGRMSEFAHKSSDEQIFRPASGRIVIGIICVVLALMVVWVAIGGAPRWLFDLVYGILLTPRHSSRPVPATLSILEQRLLFLYSLPLLAFGAFRLLQAVCGLPRLTVTSDGIEFQTAFRTKWAKWNSLENFKLREQRGSKGGVTLSATSIVSGKSAGDNLLDKAKLTIPNAFSVSIPELIAALNARRAQALGLPTEPVVQDTSDDSTGIGTAAALAGAIAIGVAAAIFAVHR